MGVYLSDSRKTQIKIIPNMHS